MSKSVPLKHISLHIQDPLDLDIDIQMSSMRYLRQQRSDVRDMLFAIGISHAEIDVIATRLSKAPTPTTNATNADNPEEAVMGSIRKHRHMDTQTDSASFMCWKCLCWS